MAPGPDAASPADRRVPSSPDSATSAAAVRRDRRRQRPAGRTGQAAGNLARRVGAGAGGRIVVAAIAGEAGIGKTQLSTEVAARLHKQGATVLYGACSQDLAAPYEPFTRALWATATRHGRQQAGDLRLGSHPAELIRLVPELRDLIPELGEPLVSDAETQRHRLFTAVASWLQAAGTAKGAVLVLDDLHWGDAGTVSLLRHLVRDAASASLLVLAVFRDTDVHRGHPLRDALTEAALQDRLVRVDLSGLSAEDIGALIRLGWAATHLTEQADALAEQVWRESDGNAFFLIEVLRHLATSEQAAEVVPRTVRDVALQRIGQLPRAMQPVLTDAAVMGDVFSGRRRGRPCRGGCPRGARRRGRRQPRPRDRRWRLPLHARARAGRPVPGAFGHPPPPWSPGDRHGARGTGRRPRRHRRPLRA